MMNEGPDYKAQMEHRSGPQQPGAVAESAAASRRGHRVAPSENVVGPTYKEQVQQSVEGGGPTFKEQVQHSERRRGSRSEPNTAAATVRAVVQAQQATPSTYQLPAASIQIDEESAGVIREEAAVAGGTAAPPQRSAAATAGVVGEGPDYKHQVQESVRGSAAATVPGVAMAAAAATAAAGGREVDYKDQVRLREEEEEERVREAQEEDGKPAAMIAEAHWMPPVIAEPEQDLEAPEPTDGLAAWVEDEEDEVSEKTRSWLGRSIYRIQKDRKSQALACLVIVLVVGGVIVGGVCGSGACSPGSNGSVPSTSPPTGETWGPGPENRRALIEAVDLFLDSTGDGCSSLPAEQYGCPIGVWQVCRITDFSRLFDATRNPAAAQFNQDVSTWNMTNAENLSAMFFNATSFNQDLCSWGDVVSATADVTNMFAWTGCSSNDDPASPEQGPWCHVCSDELSELC
jgi:hypothetical protein